MTHCVGCMDVRGNEAVIQIDGERLTLEIGREDELERILPDDLLLAGGQTERLVEEQKHDGYDPHGQKGCAREE